MGIHDAETFDRAFRRRFWAHVDKTTSDTGCWLWMGARIKASGYGYCFDGNHTTLVHRIAWRIANPLKTLGDAVICHTCDNPPCVNPAHLKTGTPRLNNYDATVKGRQTRFPTLSPVSDDEAIADRDALVAVNAIITEEMPEPLMETHQGKAARERAFRERDSMINALSKVWPAHLVRPLAVDPSFGPDYQWSVCIHTPVGMLAWRICDTTLPTYGHLEAQRGELHTDGGHVFKEKYERLSRLPRLWEPEVKSRKTR